MFHKNTILSFVFIMLIIGNFNSYGQQLSPISPRNHYVINNDSIYLKWNKLINAQSYQLKLSSDSTFTANVTSINAGLQTNYWITPLQSNTTYYWRVEGFNGSITVIGQARSFTVFKPTDMAGCALWLRADTGLAMNGTTVQSWQDVSSNNLNVSQTAPGAQATLQNNSINGYPSLSFDGNDIYTITNFPFESNTNCFVVAKRTNAAVNHGNIMAAGIYELEMHTYKCHVGPGTTGIVGSFDAANWSQVTLKRHSGMSKAYFNGIQSGVDNTITTSQIPPGNLAIGNRNPAVGNTTPLRGNISEIIVNSNLLDTLKIQINQNYLMDKYSKVLTLGEDIYVADNFCPVSISANSGFQGYLWSTGDTSAAISVNHTGIYYVQAVDIFNRIQIDSIMVSYPPVTQLTNPVLCSGSPLLWNTNLAGSYSYLWQNGSTQGTYQITTPGNYFVKITDSQGCVFYSDTAAVVQDDFPLLASIGNDTALCSGNSIQLEVGANVAVNYLWSNGTTNDSLFVVSGGDIWLEVSNINNCIARDTVHITLTGIAPIANFTSSDVCIGLEMPFNDLSSAYAGDNLTAWEWSFGDLNFSTTQNPIHLYDSADTYSVRLKVTSQTGCAGLLNKIVKVYPHPNLDFVALNNCENSGTLFLNYSQTYNGHISSIDWVFNDPNGLNNAAGDSVMHQYPQAQNYNVKMVLNTLEGCADTLLKSVVIKASPVASFEHSKLCVGDSIRFKDVSIMPFPHQNIYREWTFNDNITNQQFEPKLNYDSAGLFPVQLMVIASNGCRDTLSTIIEISEYPNADFTSNSFCLNATTTLFDSSDCINCIISSRTWLMNEVQFSSQNNATYTFNDTGNYAVKLVIENTSGCISQVEKQIHVASNPKALFALNSIYGSPPLIVNFSNESENAISYLWNFGDQNVSELFEPSHTFVDTGFYQINLFVEDINRCFDTVTKGLRVFPKRIDVTLLKVNLINNDNSIYSNINFLNKSSAIINSFDIQINSNALTTNFNERWEGFALPGELVNYKLKSSIEFNPDNESNDYLCFTILNIDKGLDENPLDNQLCEMIKLDQFKLANIFPNPAVDELNFVLVAPQSSQIEVEIVDILGQVERRKNIQLKKGYNKLNLAINQLNKGVYILRVIYNNETYSKTFIK